MPENVLTVEVGQEVEITTTTTDQNGDPIDPATIKFYLEEPDGAGPGSGDSPDVIGAPNSGMNTKYYTLSKRGTYGVTVRTISPVTVKSVHITTDWYAA